MMTGRGKRLLVAVSLAALTVLGFGAPAQASTTVVDGGGVVTNDFGDHFDELGNSLCYGCGDSWGTDLVLMWQAILYSEGRLGSSGIDGYFGSGTKTATMNFQSDADLYADGLVGENTWDVTDDRLHWKHGSLGWMVVYEAHRTSGYVAFFRGNACCAGSDGNYRLVRASNGGGTRYFDSRGISLFSRTIGRA